MNLSSQKSAIALSASAAALLMPVSAFAEDGAAGADILIPKMAEFIPALIAFLIIWIVLAKVALPGIMKTMEERGKKIEESLDEAEKTKQEAIAKRAESDSIVTDARRQAADIVLEARKDAESERARIIEVIERLASASPEIIAVLDTMSKRDQLDLLPKVAAAFKYVAEEDEDVVGVTVTTAIPLDDELRQTITKKCEQDFGRKVFLIEQVDPSIVGGLVLEARGERRDISVKTQLRIAQETLANSANSYGGEA